MGLSFVDKRISLGFNVETVNYKNISFTTWDVGGRDKIVNNYDSLISLKILFLLFATASIIQTLLSEY